MSEDNQWRTKVASGHVNGRSFNPYPIIEKETDCLHPAEGRVYVVSIGGKLANLCGKCYGEWQHGHEVVIHRRRR